MKILFSISELIRKSNREWVQRTMERSGIEMKIKAERRLDVLWRWFWGLTAALGFLALIGMAVLFAGCADATRGQTTVAERGAALLTSKGDQLMGTGIYAQKNVTKDFAEGYEAGLAAAAKQDYWSMQEEQRWLHFYTAIDRKEGKPIRSLKKNKDF
jgi:hypothetical protein